MTSSRLFAALVASALVAVTGPLDAQVVPRVAVFGQGHIAGGVTRAQGLGVTLEVPLSTGWAVTAQLDGWNSRQACDGIGSEFGGCAIDGWALLAGIRHARTLLPDLGAVYGRLSGGIFRDDGVGTDVAPASAGAAELDAGLDILIAPQTHLRVGLVYHVTFFGEDRAGFNDPVSYTGVRFAFGFHFP